MRDISIDSDMALKIENGDFAIVEDVSVQNTALILSINQGELKHAPLVGVGLDKFLLGEDLLEARHRIRQQITDDGGTVKKLDCYDSQKINIQATW